jgi:hypothetical protein
VNIHSRPVSGAFYMISLWGGTGTSRVIDLTSFAKPSDGTEHVWRFAPGRYTATFHFSVGYPQWNVSFEVRASEGPKADARALLAVAPKLAEDEKRDEAVSSCKRAILSTKNLETIQEAIGRIRRIRLRPDPDDAGHDPTRMEFDALRLALLHVSEDDRREFCRRYVRAFDRMVRDEDDATDRELLDNFSLVELFEYPQFRKILEEEVSRPDECPYPFAEVYVEGPGEKDPAVMAGLLPRYPGKVLEHYSWHKAPPEIVLLLPGYFENDTVVCETNGKKWYCKDAAFRALELAAGLDLGYRDRWDRLPDREEIEKLMRRWWHRHGHRF